MAGTVSFRRVRTGRRFRRPRTSGSWAASVGRRSQRAPVRPGDRGDPRARRLDEKLPRFRLARRDLRRARPRCAAGALAAFREDDGRPGLIIARRSKARASRSWSTRPRLYDGEVRMGGTRARRTTRRSSAPHGELPGTDRRTGERAGLDPVGSEAVPPLDPDACESWRASPRAAAGARVRGAGRPSTSPPARATRCSSCRARPELVVLDADLASDCRMRVVRGCAPRALRRRTGSRSRTWSRWRRDGPSRAGSGGQLVRKLPCLARERADLQPGERAHEGHVRDALRRAHTGRARASPTRASATHRWSGRFPSVTVVHPCNAEETREVVGCAWRRDESVAVRLAVGPSPRHTSPRRLSARAREGFVAAGGR